MSNFSSLQIRRKCDDDDEAITPEILQNTPAIVSTAQLKKFMASPEYKSSSLVRALVKHALTKSDPSVGMNVQPETKIDVSNEVAAKHAAARSRFNDPRYKRDPLFRYQVAQEIMSESPETASGKTLRVETMSSTPGQFTNVSGLGLTRIEMPATITGFYKPEPQPIERLDDNSIDIGEKGFLKPGESR